VTARILGAGSVTTALVHEGGVIAKQRFRVKVESP
jgi:hypothetical protein